jgi:shikimate dehydrogenase
MDVAPKGLAAAVAALRADPDLIGANVTIPHKETIGALLDSVTEETTAIGAVNTITRAGSRLVGRNTDVAGLRGALDALLDGRRTPRAALILGAGGAARAAVAALAAEGVGVPAAAAGAAGAGASELGVVALASGGVGVLAVSVVGMLISSIIDNFFNIIFSIDHKNYFAQN